MENIIIEKLTNIENLLKGQDRPLKFEEAAEYLGLSKSHLYKLTCSNKIPHYKPSGKRVYFAKSELDAWLLRNPIKTNTEIEQAATDYLTNGRKRGGQ
jgi:excisionase family DNA binding protein